MAIFNLTQDSRLKILLLDHNNTIGYSKYIQKYNYSGREILIKAYNAADMRATQKDIDTSSYYY